MAISFQARFWLCLMLEILHQSFKLHRLVLRKFKLAVVQMVTYHMEPSTVNRLDALLVTAMETVSRYDLTVDNLACCHCFVYDLLCFSLEKVVFMRRKESAGLVNVYTIMVMSTRSVYKPVVLYLLLY